MGFDFTLIAPLLLSHCGFSFVFRCGVSFLVSSSVLLLMIVQQLVVSLVFSQEGVRARPSTLPSWFLVASWALRECISLNTCVLVPHRVSSDSTEDNPAGHTDGNSALNEIVP